MLTDAALKKLKPKDKLYKVADRDGLYVTVLTSGVISFRYNYAINGRQETLVLGRYGPGLLTLKEAREMLAQAKKSLLEGRSAWTGRASSANTGPCPRIRPALYGTHWGRNKAKSPASCTTSSTSRTSARR